LAALQDRLAVHTRPDWYDASFDRVLGSVEMLTAARGPRELEQATAELVGAELYRALQEEKQGLWFAAWFEELASHAGSRARDLLSRGDSGWEAYWRLLHGLTSIGSPALQASAQSALNSVKKPLRGEAIQQPQWLRRMGKITATGEVWHLRDAYGTRIAVIAGFCYPGRTDPSVFLFDIDACGLVELRDAGAFDDVDQAAAAWRTRVGEPADGAQPSPAERADQLLCLAHVDAGEEILRGSESRTRMDNWFRANRRLHDLADALRKRGMPLPEATSLYRDINVEPAVGAFIDWYQARHGAEPDREAVTAVADEWHEGTLPETWQSISPHRAEHQLALINDWIDDEITIAAKTLLPDWVRWRGEQSDLPDHLVEAAVMVAEGKPHNADHFPACE
jgi:hypothetical protein